ncbi:hypothetical protein M2132_000468 [Dysgonomonas sp. PH5-45]|uniref:HU domain-containing protein n=1 Tax=unclassified Dysgonomonas TaxID=2630389 RepID=UPI002474AE89|nr:MULTISPECIES: hypothetical protein [unclassified Dysgonomonas]MDH6354146.1 hypothetical protein [Dysgonomonas sp. PH5-45]MDH6387003.1 hypothetical protein [Dysgonomonas sp. PH5-37]
MKRLISHISSLVLKHNCVIVPEFGGFILNYNNAKIDNTGLILSPKFTYAFNQNLKYNDGLLAEAYMNEENLSYEAACKEIAEDVKNLNVFLASEGTLQIENIGGLKIQEGGLLVFEPIEVFFHPSTFGCSDLSIRPLDQIMEVKSMVETKRKHFDMKRVVSGAAAVAAAIAVFFIASTPINENNDPYIHKSGFLTTVIHPNSNLNIATPSANTGEKPTVLDEPALISEVETKQPSKEADKIPATPINTAKKEVKVEVSDQAANLRYYLIVGGETDSHLAERRLNQFKNQGFANAHLLKSPDRIRIYVAAFNNKDSADSYLVQFKKNHPKYSDAWILTKK